MRSLFIRGTEFIPRYRIIGIKMAAIFTVANQIRHYTTKLKQTKTARSVYISFFMDINTVAKPTY